jgi:hypothetical protein
MRSKMAWILGTNLVIYDFGQIETCLVVSFHSHVRVWKWKGPIKLIIINFITLRTHCLLKYDVLYIIFGVLTTVKMSVLFWAVTSCGLVD